MLLIINTSLWNCLNIKKLAQTQPLRLYVNYTQRLIIIRTVDAFWYYYSHHRVNANGFICYICVSVRKLYILNHTAVKFIVNKNRC